MYASIPMKQRFQQSLPVPPKMFECIVYLFGKILNISISIVCTSCIFTSLSDGSQDTILSLYSIILVSCCGELYILRQRGFKKVRLGMSMLYVFYTSLKEKMANLPFDKGNMPVDRNVTDTNSDIMMDSSVSESNRKENDEEYENDDVTMTLDEAGDIIPISREDSYLNYTVDDDSKTSEVNHLHMTVITLIFPTLLQLGCT